MEINWIVVQPPVYQRGGLYEIKSVECGYTGLYRWTNMDISTDWICEYDPLTETKFQAAYSGGHAYEKDCDGNAALTTGDTKPEGYEYSAMTSAIIGECVTSIDNETFYGCRSLTGLAIPNSVTIIGNRTFNSCVGLTGITIPNSVTSIGEYAFGGCRSLTSATVEAATPPTLGNDVFFNTNNCPIYVPASSVEAYKSASGWSTYADRIQAIP